MIHKVCETSRWQPFIWSNFSSKTMQILVKIKVKEKHLKTFFPNTSSAGKLVDNVSSYNIRLKYQSMCTDKRCEKICH